MAETAKRAKSSGEDATPARDSKRDRVEKYKATRPDGTEVTVTHNIETGETSVS